MKNGGQQLFLLYIDTSSLLKFHCYTPKELYVEIQVGFRAMNEVTGCCVSYVDSLLTEKCIIST